MVELCANNNGMFIAKKITHLFLLIIPFFFLLSLCYGCLSQGSSSFPLAPNTA